MGFDLKQPLCWLPCFFFLGYWSSERFCISTKTEINNLYQNFCFNTFQQYSFRKCTLKCLLIGATTSMFLKFFSFPWVLQWHKKDILPFFVNLLIPSCYTATWMLFMKFSFRGITNYLTTFELYWFLVKLLFLLDDSFLSLSS